MKRILYIFAILALAACSEESEFSENSENSDNSELKENLIICNEGLWQSDNGQLSYYDGATGVLTNKWFQSVNKMKLGDTPNDIIQINDTLIAIAVNWSNIIQYIRPDGTACGATENVPNNRRLCSDGRYLYVTSYAHKCGINGVFQTFEKGYVAKIDLKTKQVIATCETGWEPEGIKLYKGRLYVANSGGYAFTEGHDYESTIQVIDAATMQTIKLIDTGYINLCCEMAQAGRWLCVSSGCDYYNKESRTVLIDCETDEFTTLPFPATLCATDGKKFYCVGEEFSYLTNESKRSIHTIDLQNLEISESRGFGKSKPRNPEAAISDEILSPNISAKLRELTAPYALYISPQTGNVYFTDAKSHATAGELYGYTKEGEPLFAPQKLYINPGRILAIKSSGSSVSPDQPQESALTVLEYLPAPGQFINKMPEATADDTPETMTRKCEETLRSGGLVSLGSFGGYITFSFDKPVQNTPGEYDFLIKGNAINGGAEPGIVMVSQDTNGNGQPDDEWFELAGSADQDSIGKVVYDYQKTYSRDAVGFPLWIKANTLTFKGTRLPNNAVNTSATAENWFLSALRFGYVDNLPNTDTEGNSFKIDWAVDKDRRPVKLENIDFIRVYCAMDQTCGWLGETSTEISGAEIIRNNDKIFK